MKVRPETPQFVRDHPYEAPPLYIWVITAIVLGMGAGVALLMKALT